MAETFKIYDTYLAPATDGDKDLGATAKRLRDIFVSRNLSDGTYTATVANIKDAVDKKHSQNTDTSLGTQTADINMGTHKLIALSVPSANGQSVRTTAKITETALEDSIDKKHTANADTKLDEGGLNEIAASEIVKITEFIFFQNDLVAYENEVIYG